MGNIIENKAGFLQTIRPKETLIKIFEIICKVCFFVIASANCCSILLQDKKLVKCYVLMSTSHY
jgi:hypothetical protein